MSELVASTVDFKKLHTAETLAEFDHKFRRMSYAIYRGWYYSPLFLGGGEAPAYRKHRNLSDRGELVVLWPNGTRFGSQAERNLAAVENAALEWKSDPTRAETLASARTMLEEASRRGREAYAARGKVSS